MTFAVPAADNLLTGRLYSGGWYLPLTPDLTVRRVSNGMMLARRSLNLGLCFALLLQAWLPAVHAQSVTGAPVDSVTAFSNHCACCTTHRHSHDDGHSHPCDRDSDSHPSGDCALCNAVAHDLAPAPKNSQPEILPGRPAFAIEPAVSDRPSLTEPPALGRPPPASAGLSLPLLN